MSEFTTREGVAGKIIIVNVIIIGMLITIIFTGTTKVSSPAQLEAWSRYVIWDG